MADVPSPLDVLSGGKGGVYTEPRNRRIRAMLGGRTIVDSNNVILAWEHRFYPSYYVPFADVEDGVLSESELVGHHDLLGTRRYWNVSVGDRVRADGAWHYPQALPEVLQSCVRFDWSAADSWYEEDEEVFVHPKSPYVRIDTRTAARNVQIELKGQVLAQAAAVVVLYETGLPPRYYLHRHDVRMDLLRGSSLLTECPYKGQARHWNAVFDGVDMPNVAWTYESPLPESVAVRGLVSFYPDSVDLTVDGELLNADK